MFIPSPFVCIGAKNFDQEDREIVTAALINDLINKCNSHYKLMTCPQWRCIKRARLASMAEKRIILWFPEVLEKIKLVRIIEDWP